MLSKGPPELPGLAAQFVASNPEFDASMRHPS